MQVKLLPVTQALLPAPLVNQLPANSLGKTEEAVPNAWNESLCPVLVGGITWGENKPMEENYAKKKKIMPKSHS